jgi:hypothetical protein
MPRNAGDLIMKRIYFGRRCSRRRSIDLNSSNGTSGKRIDWVSWLFGIVAPGDISRPNKPLGLGSRMDLSMDTRAPHENGL